MCKKQEFLNYVGDWFVAIGCSYPVAQWISFQFALESNFGRSRLARVNHNLCGMKVPTYRPSTNIGTTGFAKYLSHHDCLVDYSLWLAYSKFNVFELRDLDVFKERLVALHYCPEPDYIERIDYLLLTTKF